MNETFEQVLNELRFDVVHDAGWFYDRIRSAHERELAAKDAEIARLKSKCDEYERQPELMAETAKAALELIKSQDAEIARLKAALKPVLECEMARFGDCTLYGDLMTAVREAQRIMKEGGVA